MEINSTLIIAVAFAFVIAFVFSMFGQGGGSVYSPLLLLLGFSALISTSTSLVLNLITSLAAGYIFYRKKGIEPSQIPLEIRREVIQFVYDQTDEAMFKVEARPDFTYKPVKGSFNKTKCSACGEYVFDRYVRMKDGQPACIPCSGYEKTVLVER